MNRAHPRSRGEHGDTLLPSGEPIGSSPLARGTLVFAATRPVRGRLIPARAGNTRGCSCFRLPCTAHPRSRGEHVVLCVDDFLFFGSSPLARGTRGCCPCPHGRSRLIPARAGNTTDKSTFEMCAAAHPRSRGEHWLVHLRVVVSCGSSPLARGTHEYNPRYVSHIRLIPARAGNTAFVSMSRLITSAHPRSRGEHLVGSSSVGLGCGSSPLARGTHAKYDVATCNHRLIPARAGNTLADMGFYPLHQQNRITLEPEPASRIHDKQ